MPTTTVVFKFMPGDEIQHIPGHDNILNKFQIYATHGITTSNVVSDTIDVETSTRTVVREWANHEIATEFLTELQTTLANYDNGPATIWPGQLINAQVNTQ